MAEMTSEGVGGGAGIDLSQFFQVFFEEAGENLQRMEQLLLELDIEAADDEEMNAIFRCAHSVKGGAATFGFADVAELTHEMETLLDKLRRHELALHARMIDVLLEAGDALAHQLGRHQGSGADALDTSELLLHIKSLASGEAPPPAAPVVAAAAVAAVAAAAAADPAAAVARPVIQAPVVAAQRELDLRVGPLADPKQADNLIELFAEITDLGSIEPLDMGQASDGMRRFKVVTRSTDAELLDLFTFHVAREAVQLSPFGAGYGFHAGNPGVPMGAAPLDTDPAPVSAPPAAAAPAPAADPGYGFFDDAPGAPTAPGAAASAAAPAAPQPAAHASASEPKASAVAKPAAVRHEKPASGGLDSSTLRVSVEKVDQLINLVGELVITQAMLAQNSRDLDPVVYQTLIAGLNDLDRNTRDLQEAVMSIRMIPMSTVFNRFPRMLRDLAAKLGKKVELITQGEATELDKGLIEKITDPLTHLVRNSCDHGCEMPADRLACGKPETGTITLSASHQGGSVVIEVRDDGRGLSRDK
ncbi:MAG: hypothetical protein RLZZ524_1367, partial [Pseudomonadota bacterium]